MSAFFTEDAAMQLTKIGYPTNIEHDELRHAILDKMHLPNARKTNNPWSITDTFKSDRIKGEIMIIAKNQKDHLEILATICGTLVTLKDIEKIN